MVTTIGVLRAFPKKKTVQKSQDKEPHQSLTEEAQVPRQSQPVQLVSMTSMEGCSRPHGPVSTTVDSAQTRVSEQVHTSSTAVTTTGTSDDFGFTSPGLLRGFRKRWIDRRSEGSDYDPSLFGGSECGEPESDDPWTTGASKKARSEVSDYVPSDFADPFRGEPGFNDVVDVGASKKFRAGRSSAVHVMVEDVADSEVHDVDPGSRQADLGTLPKHSSEGARATSLNVFKFPWETGRLGKFFSDDNAFNLKPPSLQPGGRNFISMCLEVSKGTSTVAKVKVQREVNYDSIFQAVVKKAEDITLQESRKKQRHAAIDGWWKLLSSEPSANAIGQRAMEEVSAYELDEYAAEILEATFAVKAPGTLRKRMYAIQGFSDWCIEHGLGSWQPVVEKHAWMYVRSLQTDGAAATKGASFLEALRFCHYLLGVQGADDVVQSLRVHGVAMQMRACKQPWRPADTLSLAEIKELRRILGSSATNAVDKVFAGHMLHLLYSRSRWSDLTEVGHLYIDPCSRFLELDTRSHKGAKTAELKSRLLPLVAPTRGVVNVDWVSQYMEARKAVDLQVPKDVFMPMLPAPLDISCGGWSERPLSSEEGAAFLRRALNAPKTDERRISSHSLKSTLLSWTCKFGLSDTTRAVLARHMSTVSTATAVYSRDLLSPVLRELDGMLEAIRCGAFLPDNSRSGMLTPGFVPSMPMTPGALFTGRVPQTPPPMTPGELEMARAIHVPKEPHQAAGRCEDVDVGRSVMSGSFELVGSDEVRDANEAFNDFGTGLGDSDTSEEPSETSTSDSDVTVVTEVETEPCPERTGSHFINMKTQVLHQAKSDVVFRCGRAITKTYARVAVLHGIRCSRCYNV